MALQRTRCVLQVLDRVAVGLDRIPGRVCRKLAILKPNRLLHHCQFVSETNRIASLSSSVIRQREYNITWCQIAAFATDTKQNSQPTDTDVVNKTEPGGANIENKEDTPEDDETSLTVFQRFKRAYKEHGKILIGVHVATSCVWFGSFFYAAHTGVDIIPLMEYLGLSDTIIKPFRNSSLGDAALAYLMYKLATPARYTVTLAGTNYMIKYLRHTGKMEPKQESLRELVKDSRAEMRERTDQLRERTDTFMNQFQQNRPKFSGSEETKDVNGTSKQNDSRVDR